MKLTKRKLKQIIKEEIKQILNEEPRVYIICRLAKQGDEGAIKGLKNWRDPGYAAIAKRCLKQVCEKYPEKCKD